MIINGLILFDNKKRRFSNPLYHVIGTCVSILMGEYPVFVGVLTAMMLLLEKDSYGKERLPLFRIMLGKIFASCHLQVGIKRNFNTVFEAGAPVDSYYQSVKGQNLSCEEKSSDSKNRLPLDDRMVAGLFLIQALKLSYLLDPREAIEPMRRIFRNHHRKYSELWMHEEQLGEEEVVYYNGIMEWIFLLVLESCEYWETGENRMIFILD